jgi:hypothetical protein
MSLLNKLERRLGRFAIPNVTLGLIAGQVGMYILSRARPDLLEATVLLPKAILAGELWRIGTTLLIPPFGDPLCAIFGWYLFWLMGTALENFWGTFRYNVYLLVCIVATVAVSFITPDQPAWHATAFLYGSVFLAFAFLNPDFELYLMFILPVKIKWLALLTWLGYGATVLVGSWTDRLLVLASVVNFLLFFAREILDKFKTGRRRMAFQAKQFAVSRMADEPFHRCVACGITDRSHPTMDFRYCTQCKGSCGYCTEHIFNHAHVTAETVTTSP